MILEFLATAAAGIFAGAALYINVAEHPARVECGTKLAVTVFAPSYRRAAPMQASLAAVGLVAGVGAWFRGGDGWWLIAALMLGSVIPLTFVAIMSTNGFFHRIWTRNLPRPPCCCGDGVSCTPCAQPLG